MKQIQKLLLLIVSAVMFTGCASIQSGTTQEVKVSSNPAGATVYTALRAKTEGGTVMNKVAVGVTPLTVRIPRKDGAIMLEKEGFQPVAVPLVTGMNPWVWGDIVLTSLLSTSIDTSYEYDPGEYMVDMKPLLPAPEEKK